MNGSRRTLLPCLAALLFALGGCDASVDLLTPDGRALFSVHGYLDAAADTQWVRIEPLRRLVAPDAGDVQGVEVVSTRVADGAQVHWEYVPRTDATGSPAHIYRAVFRPMAGETYRVEVVRDGAAGAVAEARVPPPAVLEVPPTDTGDGSFVTQRLLFSGAAGSPQQIRVVYTLRAPGSEASVRLAVDYGDVSGIEGGRFVVSVYPSRDRSELLFRLGVPPDARGVVLEQVAVGYVLLSPEWSDRAPDPGLRTGHGFFAARGVYEAPWRLSPGAAATLGWGDAQPPGRAR